jgi:hypothetical protein
MRLTRSPRAGGSKMSAESSANYRTMPDLTAVQVSDGQWAVVSDNKRKPLTQAEANIIIDYFVAVDELLKSTI